MIPDRHRAEAPVWNDVARQWPSVPDALWRRHADRVNTELCHRWLPEKPVRWLLKTDAFDESVGSGLWPVLCQHAEHVVAIDVAQEMSRRAKARHAGFRAATADVRRLPFASGQFDVVVSNSTLDHFERRADLALAVRELQRVLAPGGRLILTLDNPTNPIVGLRNALPFAWVARTGLVPYFVGATLRAGPTRDLLESLGFTVREVTAILHAPRVLAIPLANRLDRPGGTTASRQRLDRWLQRCERAGLWRTRFITGHFVAVLADKL